MRGNLIGKVTFDDSKKPYYTEGTSKNGNDWCKIVVRLTDANNNKTKAELLGTKQKSLYLMDKDNQKLTVKWEDRNDKEIIESVAVYKKHHFNYIDNEDKFILADYDAVKYIADHADEINGDTIGISVDVEKNIYKGKVYDRFNIQNIYAVDSSSESKFVVSMDFFFNKDSIDLSDWKTEKKITFDGYIQSYVAEKKKTMYIPQRVVLDASKADMSNDEHRKRLALKLFMMGCKADGDNIKCIVKSNTMYKIGLICKYISSAKEVDVDEDDLTDVRKMFIEAGLKSVQNFADKKAFGEMVVEYDIINFQIEREDYANGYLNLDIKPDEFEENIYKPVENESEDDLPFADAMNPPTEEDIEESNREIDKLFS